MCFVCVVRGISQIREALLFATEFEVGGDRDTITAFVDTKFQIIIAAQVRHPCVTDCSDPAVIAEFSSVGVW